VLSIKTQRHQGSMHAGALDLLRNRHLPAQVCQHADFTCAAKRGLVSLQRTAALKADTCDQHRHKMCACTLGIATLALLHQRTAVAWQPQQSGPSLNKMGLQPKQYKPATRTKRACDQNKAGLECIDDFTGEPAMHAGQEQPHAALCCMRVFCLLHDLCTYIHHHVVVVQLSTGESACGTRDLPVNRRTPAWQVFKQTRAVLTKSKQPHTPRACACTCLYAGTTPSRW